MTRRVCRVDKKDIAGEGKGSGGGGDEVMMFTGICVIYAAKLCTSIKLTKIFKSTHFQKCQSVFYPRRPLDESYRRQDITHQLVSGYPLALLVLLQPSFITSQSQVCSLDVPPMCDLFEKIEAFSRAGCLITTPYKIRNFLNVGFPNTYSSSTPTSQSPPLFVRQTATL
jgi:hypothetical protein